VISRLCGNKQYVEDVKLRVAGTPQTTANGPKSLFDVKERPQIRRTATTATTPSLIGNYRPLQGTQSRD